MSNPQWPKARCRGEEYPFPSEEWFTIPNMHGLASIKHHKTFDDREQFGVVLWSAFGYWQAQHLRWRKQAAEHLRCEHFHSEEDAKKYLDTLLALAPEK